MANDSNLQRIAGPGRPPGPQLGRLRNIFIEIAEEQPELLKSSVLAGLAATPPKSAPYVTLASAYAYGKPTERVELSIRSVVLGVGQLALGADPWATPVAALPAETETPGTETLGESASMQPDSVHTPDIDIAKS